LFWFLLLESLPKQRGPMACFVVTSAAGVEVGARDMSWQLAGPSGTMQVNMEGPPIPVGQSGTRLSSGFRNYERGPISTQKNAEGDFCVFIATNGGRHTERARLGLGLRIGNNEHRRTNTNVILLSLSDSTNA
jgi:hypothetical protein